MKRHLIILALLAVATPANAAVKTYFTPQQEGTRLWACLADQTTCGKAVADAFCQAQGFSESILFAREAVSEARLLGGETLCSGAQCEAFTRIKCFTAGEQAATITP
jgi:hypothetical protein